MNIVFILLFNSLNLKKLELTTNAAADAQVIFVFVL